MLSSGVRLSVTGRGRAEGGLSTDHGQGARSSTSYKQNVLFPPRSTTSESGDSGWKDRAEMEEEQRGIVQCNRSLHGDGDNEGDKLGESTL